MLQDTLSCCALSRQHLVPVFGRLPSGSSRLQGRREQAVCLPGAVVVLPSLPSSPPLPVPWRLLLSSLLAWGGRVTSDSICPFPITGLAPGRGEVGEKLHPPPCNSTCCPGLEVLCPASATGQVTPEQCVLTVSLALGSDWACPGAAACPGTTPPGPQIPCSPSHLSSFHPHRAQPCRMEVRLLFALGWEAGIIFRGGGSPQAAWCQGQGASRQ